MGVVNPKYVSLMSAFTLPNNTLCCVVLGLQAVCHARIMRRLRYNLGQWKIQP